MGGIKLTGQICIFADLKINKRKYLAYRTTREIIVIEDQRDRNSVL